MYSKVTFKKAEPTDATLLAATRLGRRLTVEFIQTK